MSVHISLLLFARIFMFVLFRLYMYDMDNVYVCIVLTKWSNKNKFFFFFFFFFCFPCLAGAVKFLYSTILSLRECSKHFTLHFSPVHSLTVSGSRINIQPCSIYYTETIESCLEQQGVKTLAQCLTQQHEDLIF